MLIKRVYFAFSVAGLDLNMGGLHDASPSSCCFKYLRCCDRCIQLTILKKQQF